MAFRAGVLGVTNDLGFDESVFGEFLVGFELAKWNRVDANPSAVLPQSGGADEFTVFGRERRVGFDGDEDPLDGNCLDVFGFRTVF